MTPNHHEIRVGATNELSLRVSVATLVRVLLKSPSDGELMLALERKATLHETENGHTIQTKSQPFGGAIRILDLNAVRDLIGDFRFDSERSRTEQDFRLFIRPSDWSMLREFCLQHLSRDQDPILETDPARELAEEFASALKVDLKPEQYRCWPVAIVVEQQASPTKNFYAMGHPTARIYRIFEASITDPSLTNALLKNSEGLLDAKLHELALKDFETGGKGWANAVLALPLIRIQDIYRAMPFNERDFPIMYEKTLLDETVPAILEEPAVPKYQRVQ